MGARPALCWWWSVRPLWPRRTNKPLYRAYLLKEQLREIVAVNGDDGKPLLASWLRWAGRSRLEPFVSWPAASADTYTRFTTCSTPAYPTP